MASSFNGDIYQVTLVGLIHGQTTMTTFHYRLVAVGSPPPVSTTTNDVYQALDTAIAVAGGLAADFKACCPTSWSHIGTWFQKVAPTRIVKFTAAILPTPGLRADADVTNIQASITRRTEDAHRTGVGGIRVPLSDQDVVAGKLVASLLTALDNLGQEMLNTLDITAATGHVLEPVLYARINPTTFRSAPLYAVIVQDTARTIRRRTVGLGI